MNPIAKSLLTGVTGLATNLARSSPATLRTTLPGLQSSVKPKSMGWLADAIGITTDIAQFIKTAVTGGKINRDLTRGNTQYYKTIGSPPSQNGKPVGLRFDPSQGLSNTSRDSDYELTGVQLDKDSEWISPPGASLPVSTPLLPARPSPLTLHPQRLTGNFYAQSTRTPSVRPPMKSNATSLLSQTGAAGATEINANRPSELTRRPAMRTPRTRFANSLPENILAAQAKPTANKERIKANAFLDSLHNIKLTTEKVVRWEDLDQETQNVYKNNRNDFESEVVQNNNGMRPEIIKILNENDMSIVENLGITGDKFNNCFLISVLQHSTGDYTKIDSTKVNSYRSMLNDKGLIAENEQMSSNSTAAKSFMNHINNESGSKIDFHIISRTNDELYVERHINEQGKHEEQGRKVFIFDHGGHFEAIAQNR